MKNQITKFKDKKNNKGFSMVELLAVIVILGVISTIGIATVSKLVERSRNNYYLTQQKQMILATQAYVNDNRNILPKQIGSFTTVKLKELMDKKYITDEIVDQSKTPCDPLNSRVDIYKASTTDYKYVGYLECDACKKLSSDGSKKCYDENDKKAPVITIGIPNVSSNQSTNTNSAISIEIKGAADDANIKVSSYSYKIYVDGILKKNTGLLVNNKDNKITINKDKIFNYVPGTIKVVVTATNTDGITKSKASTNDLSDVLAPACGRITYENNNKLKDYDYVNPNDIKCGSTDYPWINIGQPSAIRQAWVLCNDEFKLGCAQHEFSSVLETDGEDQDVPIKDKKGNSQTCRIKKCIDKTTPKITVQIKSGSTVKETFKVDPQRTTQLYTKTETYSTWLNKANYPEGVTVVATIEEPTSKIKSFVWKHNPKNQKESAVGDATETIVNLNPVNEEDYTDFSTGKLTKSTTITDDGVRKEEFTILDNAGNKLTYTLILKIDRTEPSSCTNVLKLENATGAAYDTSKWTNKSVYTTASCSADAMSGCSTSGNKITTTGSTTNVTDASHETWTVHAQGTSHTQYKVRDVAGNYKTCSQNNEYVDKTYPKCTISGDGIWNASGAYISTTCEKNDSYSDIASCQGSTPHNSTTNVVYTTTDAAGNSSTCSYTVSTATERRAKSCTLYNQSKPTCGETYKKCRRKAHDKVTHSYSNNDDDHTYQHKSNMDSFINSAFVEIANKLEDATYSVTITDTYKRNKNFNGETVIVVSGPDGCTNIDYDTNYQFLGTKAMKITTMDKETCYEAKIQTGNFYTNGRWKNGNCYLGVSEYYWDCDTSSHKKHFDFETRKLIRAADCGVEYINRCENAGCETWGDWSGWSQSVAACNSNSCQSEERIVYK